MKYGPVSKTDAIYTGDISMVCGIVESGKYIKFVINKDSIKI